MDILKLSQVAQNYYEGLKAQSLAQGWDKYVATNGVQCLFVDSSYEPQPGEAVFFLTTRNRSVSCKLYKSNDGTPQDRFTIVPESNLKWKVTDHVCGIEVTFYEGAFNQTQKFVLPETMTQEQMLTVQKPLSQIGDWIAQNHANKAICDIQARAGAIATINREEFWLTIAAALNGIQTEWEDEQYSAFLAGEVEDYIESYDTPFLEESEHEDLIGCLELLSDDEAKEAVKIVKTFWESNRDAREWARDVLWWPSFIPQVKTTESEE